MLKQSVLLQDNLLQKPWKPEEELREIFLLKTSIHNFSSPKKSPLRSSSDNALSTTPDSFVFWVLFEMQADGFAITQIFERPAFLANPGHYVRILA